MLVAGQACGVRLGMIEAEAMTQQPSALVGDSVASPEPALGDNAKPKKDKTEKKKHKKHAGVETMFRVTYSNHVALSRLADAKANILISINGVIISIVIALLRAQFGTLSWDAVPVLVLIVGCMVSLAFAVIGARPRLSRAKITVDDIRNNNGNVLFFGQFTSLSLSEFQESLRLLMDDSPLLYDNLGRQLYLMGQSLNKKYWYLQIAYTVFLAATGLATALFVITYLTIGFGAFA
jgi:hypothetical protein